MNSGSFTTTTLGEVCSSVDYGYTASASSDPDIGPKFLRITDIVPDYLVWDSVPHCEIEPNKRDKFLLDEGDIVVARTGATVGYAKQIWARPEGATFASYLVRFRPDGGRVDPRYLGQIVQSAAFKRWVKSVAGGAAQPNANAKVLGSYELQLPPVAQQEIVGRVLWAFDDLIENNRRRIEILEEMVRLLYREWFVHFRFPGHEDVELVDSERGPVPEGWDLVALGTVLTFHGSGATPRGGKDSYKAEGVPLVRSMNVYDLRFEEDGLVFIDAAQAADLQRVTIEPHDVLLNITGASVARCSLAPPSVTGGRVNQHVMILRFDRSKAEPMVVAQALAGPYKSKLLSIAGSGATREALTKADVETFKVLLPTPELQSDFRRQVEPMGDLVHILGDQNRVMRDARELLLPRLVSGELDVSELDLDGVLA